MTTTQVGHRVVPVLVRPPDLGDSAGPATTCPARVRRVLSAGAATVVLTYLAVTSWPSLVASSAALRHLSTGWVAPVIVAQLVSMAAPALVHHRLLRARQTPVGFRALLGITYASNSVSVTLPLAGPEIATAYTFRQLLRRGADSAAAGWTLLISGVASALTFTLIVVGSAAATGNTTATVLTVGTALLAAAAAGALLRLLRNPGARSHLERTAAGVMTRARRVTRRPAPTGTADSVGSFLRRITQHRLGRRDTAAVGGLALLNWVADVLCLAAAITAVGAAVPWTGLALAYVAGTGVAGLRLTPGGLGVVEAAMATGLITVGLGVPEAIAAVLLYRLVAFWLVLVAGWVAFLAARRADGPRGSTPATPDRTLGRTGAHPHDLEDRT